MFHIFCYFPYISIATAQVVFGFWFSLMELYSLYSTKIYGYLGRANIMALIQIDIFKMFINIY